MTSTSEQIRNLARLGLSVSEIASRLDLRYQHAYSVCRKAGLLPHRSTGAEVPPALATKPRLSLQHLLDCGFTPVGHWSAKDGLLICNADLPHKAGVYAFSISGEVMYVGLAARSLARRIRFYSKPGISQRTNIRLNALILQVLSSGDEVTIACACPPASQWNGLPVHGAEGLEAGLIAHFLLPWNMRGSGSG